MAAQKCSKLGLYLKENGITQKLLAIQLRKAYKFNPPTIESTRLKVHRLCLAKTKKTITKDEINEIVRILQKLNPECTVDTVFDIL